MSSANSNPASIAGAWCYYVLCCDAVPLGHIIKTRILQVGKEQRGRKPVLLDAGGDVRFWSDTDDIAFNECDAATLRAKKFREWKEAQA